MLEPLVNCIGWSPWNLWKASLTIPWFHELLLSLFIILLKSYGVTGTLAFDSIFICDNLAISCMSDQNLSIMKLWRLSLMLSSHSALTPHLLAPCQHFHCRSWVWPFCRTTNNMLLLHPSEGHLLSDQKSSLGNIVLCMSLRYHYHHSHHTCLWKHHLDDHQHHPCIQLLWVLSILCSSCYILVCNNVVLNPLAPFFGRYTGPKTEFSLPLTL